jgi:hypothetical protein
MSPGDGLPPSKSAAERPLCQVANCFEPASVYIVIKETDVNLLAIDHKSTEADRSGDVNAFKLILYLCARHDYDLKYLLKENELEISKRRHLILKEAS